MNEKQDRQGARTVSDFEQKYNFGKKFSEIMGVASDASNAASRAESAVSDLDNNLSSEEIFNRLTENGTLQGVYRGDDGEIYINASYIKSGIIKSHEGDIYFDLDNGIIRTEYNATPYTKRIFSINSRGMVAYETGADGTNQEVFNTVFNTVGSGAMFGTVICDDDNGGNNPRGISLQGVGGTGVGSTSSDTFVSGKNIYLVDENNTMMNLFAFIAQVKEALGL